MRVPRFRTWLLLGALAALPSPASAQDLTYTQRSTMEMGGALGAMMSMMSDETSDMTEVVRISDGRMRRDADDGSTIVDWSTGTMYQLHHGSRTFTQLDLAQMADMMAGQMEGAGMPPASRDADGERPQFEVRLSTDRTGERQRIAGYDAERVLLVMELVPVEGADVPDDALMAVVSDLWLSTDFPEYRMQQELGEQAAEAFQAGVGQGWTAMMQGVAAGNPGMGEAWRENMEVLQEVEGTPLRTTITYVMIPPGARLDRDQLLAKADEPIGGSASGSAADAMRSALGGLAGRFGRRSEQEQPEPEATIFMRMVTEVDGVEQDALDPGIFQPPADYTRREITMPRR